MPVETRFISCACGAEYERSEAKLPIKDVGIYECRACGEVLERWHGKTVPVFKLVQKPQSKDASAA